MNKILLLSCRELSLDRIFVSCYTSCMEKTMRKKIAMLLIILSLVIAGCTKTNCTIQAVAGGEMYCTEQIK